MAGSLHPSMRHPFPQLNGGVDAGVETGLMNTVMGGFVVDKLAETIWAGVCGIEG